MAKKCLCRLLGISKHIINKLRAPGSPAAPHTRKAIFCSFFNVIFSHLDVQEETALILDKKDKTKKQGHSISANGVSNFVSLANSV